MSKIMDWLWVVLAAVLALWFASGCVLAETLCPPCPACECGLDECVDLVGDLFDGDE